MCPPVGYYNHLRSIFTVTWHFLLVQSLVAVWQKNISFEQSWFCILVILSPYVSDPEESIHALETGILAEGLE